MFDFAADARDEGGVQGRNNKGLVTYDRKTKKDAFYIYQAYWTTEPMIHVCGERFVDRAPEERIVTVYTNCPNVTLVVNGEEVATKDAVDHAVVFENVALNDGDNTVTATCGDVQANTITLRPVAEHNYAYDLPEGNEGANWFDDPAAIAARKKMNYPAGYYNIKDKVCDLMANPEAAAAVQEIMAAVMGGSSFSMMDTVPGEDNPMKDFFLLARLNNLLKMAGKAVTLEMKYELNEKLNKIKKD